MSFLEQMLQEKYGTGFKQRHLREWYVSRMVFQQTERKEKHDSDRRQQTRNIFLRGKSMQQIKFLWGGGGGGLLDTNV
jgi:hypothetical protein